MASAKAASAPTKEINRLRDLKVGVRDLIMLDPNTIHIERGFNPRNYKLPENHAHLDALKASIKEKGVEIPLLVRYEPESKQAILVDGECRLRSVLELNREGDVQILSVPVIQVSGNNPADRLVTALTANTAKNLSKWESGTAFQRLVKFGWEIEQIAVKLGFSEKFVREAVELADAPDDVKMLLSERAVTPQLALYQLRRKGTGAGKDLREAVELAKASGKKIAKAPKRAPTQPLATEPARVSMAATVADNDPDDLTTAVRELLSEADLEIALQPDADNEWVDISVNRIQLAEVARIVGLTDQRR